MGCMIVWYWNMWGERRRKEEAGWQGEQCIWRGSNISVVLTDQCTTSHPPVAGIFQAGITSNSGWTTYYQTLFNLRGDSCRQTALNICYECFILYLDRQRVIYLLNKVVPFTVSEESVIVCFGSSNNSHVVFNLPRVFTFPHFSGVRGNPSENTGRYKRGERYAQVLVPSQLGTWQNSIVYCINGFTQFLMI